MRNMKRIVLFTLVLIVGLETSGFGQNAPTNSTRYPLIVAKVSLTNQTAQIPWTTLVTPTATHLYRISVYMDGPRENDWSLDVLWTDDNGQQGAGVQTNNPGNYVTWVATIRDMAGSPLKYQVAGSEGSYSLSLTVEQLE